MGKPPRIYTLLGCTIEVAPGGQSAKASRVEMRDSKGRVVRSAASKTFSVIREHGAPDPDVQAIRWVHSLPAIIEQKPAPTPAEPAKPKGN